MEALLIVALFIVVLLWLFDRKKTNGIIHNLKFLLSNNSSNSSEKQKLILKIEELEKKNQRLSKYEAIVEVEEEMDELRAKGQQDLNEMIRTSTMIKDDADRVFKEATEKAKNILEEAYRKVDEEMGGIREKAQQDLNETIKNSNTIKANAEHILEEASNNARAILEEANRKAEEIAGDAYKALRNANDYEKTAKAMKNIIDGYGDQYIIPTFSLLDDLSEEFGHTEAGNHLAKAREKTRILIKNKMAAECEYIEPIRKETAVNFVLDAFNGKVDSVLSKVKKDNYGTLEQKIKDAFFVVNNNGKAFKNAHITQTYLAARLSELKWAVITQELKWEEQEEQRRLKEQIREEEKARREYEKAIKETQKEEESLKKMLEKTQREVLLATDEQKEKYEAKLRELEERLKLAEEKNQRALSMAQQTKSGNVYVISNIGSFGENVYKIGMTRRLEPLDRIRELGDASVPFEFDVHSIIYSNDAPKLERELHKKFLNLQVNKVNPRKEFFKVNIAQIKEQIELMGIESKWTLTAEARQYKESLAIEQEIATDGQKQLEWEKYQLQAEPVLEEAEEMAE